MTGALARRAAIMTMMIAMLSVTACARVPAGHRGIKVYLLGGEKGVNEVELGVGRYFYWPITQEIYIFPIFQQNYTWTKRNSSGEDKSITFQTREGLSVNGDFGISYSVDESRVSMLFQRYRRGLDEITDLFLRNMIRDEMNNVASRMEIEAVYGEQRQEMLREAEAGPEHVVRMTWYVADRRDYLAAQAEIGRAYRAVMGAHYPAMTLVEVAALLEEGALVEIEATAVLPNE